MAKLIIFDCDGVLVDSEALANQATVDLLNQEGLAITYDQYLTLSLGKVDEEAFKDLQTQFNCSFDADFLERVYSHIINTFTQDLQPISGVQMLLNQLKIPKCVASSSRRDRLNHSLQVTGLWESFNGAVYSAPEVGRGKPAPDVFVHAAAQFQADPKDCLVIEDSSAGVRAAVAAKMPVIGFVGGAHCSPSDADKLQQLGAIKAFDSMDEIADFIHA